MRVVITLIILVVVFAHDSYADCSKCAHAIIPHCKAINEDKFDVKNDMPEQCFEECDGVAEHTCMINGPCGACAHAFKPLCQSMLEGTFKGGVPEACPEFCATVIDLRSICMPSKQCMQCGRDIEPFCKELMSDNFNPEKHMPESCNPSCALEMGHVCMPDGPPKHTPSAEESHPNGSKGKGEKKKPTSKTDCKQCARDIEPFCKELMSNNFDPEKHMPKSCDPSCELEIKNICMPGGPPKHTPSAEEYHHKGSKGKGEKKKAVNKKKNNKKGGAKKKKPVEEKVKGCCGKDYCSKEMYEEESVPTCGKCLYDQQCDGFWDAYADREPGYGTGLVFCCPKAKRCVDLRGPSVGCPSGMDEAKCPRRACGGSKASKREYPFNCDPCENKNWIPDWINDMKCKETGVAMGQPGDGASFASYLIPLTLAGFGFYGGYWFASRKN